MPDEYLPPNKILFIQNLLETSTKDDLENIFKAYPNLHDVRLIPGRKGIAFVEYTDEASSTVAREALHNYKIDEEHKMKVRLLSCSCILVNGSKANDATLTRSHTRSSDEKEVSIDLAKVYYYVSIEVAEMYAMLYWHTYITKS